MIYPFSRIQWCTWRVRFVMRTRVMILVWMSQWRSLFRMCLALSCKPICSLSTWLNRNKKVFWVFHSKLFQIYQKRSHFKKFTLFTKSTCSQFKKKTAHPRWIFYSVLLTGQISVFYVNWTKFKFLKRLKR